MSTTETIIDVALLPHPVTVQPWRPTPPGGAQCDFAGYTRPDTHEQFGSLVALDYEAHEAMALARLDHLAREAARRWSPLAIRIHHATGRVAIGEASVVIQVACGHRAESFEACRWLIDELKSAVPIWKREVWQTGSSWAHGTPLATPATSLPA